MNTIDTTNIVDPNQDQPFFGKSLAFLQTATKQMIQGLVESIVGDSFDGSKAYVISRLNPYGTNQYTDGWVFYNYELYYCPGKSTTTAFSNVPVLTITDLSDSSVDPTQFSNGVNFNVHRLRTMVLSDAISGSGTVDLSACIYVQSKIASLKTPSYGTVLPGHRVQVNYLIDSDLNGWYTPSTGKFLPSPGWYEVSASLELIATAGSPVTFGYLNLEKNGSAYISLNGSSVLDAVNNRLIGVSGSYIFYANGTDYFNLVQGFFDQNVCTISSGLCTFKKVQ